MGKIKQIDRSKLGLIGLMLAVVLFFSVNIIAAFALKNYRTDLTEAKLYSLSAGSKEAIKRIKEPLTIKFYMSSKMAKASELHAAYAVRVIELLEQYAAEADGKIKLEVIDPEPFSKNEDEALTNGMKGIPLTGSSEYVYMGMQISNSSDRKRVIPLLDPTRERFLEYDITKYLTDLTRSKRPTIGVMSTLPIDGQGEPHLIYPKYLPRWAIMKQIRDIFDVRFISRQTLDIAPEIDVLMLVNPKKLTDETMYAVDQFLMRGKPLLILMDPLSETEIEMGESSYAISSNLNNLFVAWGVNFETTAFVGDMTLARTTTKTTDEKTIQDKFLPWITVNEKYLNPHDPITGALGLVNFAYAGHFTVKKKFDDLTVSPLIFSSADSMLFLNRLGVNPNPETLKRLFKPNGKNYVLGMRLKGMPDSAFDKAPTRNFLKQRPEAHLNKAVKPTNIVLIADSDFLADKNWTTKEDLLGIEQLYPFASNGDLIVNALDNLSDSASLIDLRSKAEWRRPFAVLEELSLKSGRQYREQESRLHSALNEAEKQLKALTEKSSVSGKDLLDRKEMEQMRDLQNQIVALRTALRNVQGILSRDILLLQSTIIALNVVLVPILLMVAALFVAWRRRSRRLSVAGKE